jgi:glycosyltransferase involved in cell wall biosynthesis
VRVAVFDYKAIPNNPIGGCHWRMLRGLCNEYDFTVFAAEFDNPCPERIRYVHVPAIKRPLALLFVTFHMLAPIWYLAYRLRHRVRFDRLQMVESNLWFGDTSYCHFCHRSFLRNYRQQIGTWKLRSLGRLLDHWLHSLTEPRVFRKVKRIVVPSLGLAAELKREYPFAADKIVVLPNPVELERMRVPTDFDRTAFRSSQGWGADDVVLVFVALGHFERKGLPQVLDAMVSLKTPRLKFYVVGGEPGLTSAYEHKCRELGLSEQVKFVGMQKDVRPFLWGADAFVLPSYYETFSLGTFEAAAAGLPVLVSRLYGVEEFLIDGQNGYLIDTTVEGVRAGLQRLLASSVQERSNVGAKAASSVRAYGLDAFLNGWKKLYAA